MTSLAAFFTFFSLFDQPSVDLAKYFVYPGNFIANGTPHIQHLLLKDIRRIHFPGPVDQIMRFIYQ